MAHPPLQRKACAGMQACREAHPLDRGPHTEPQTCFGEQDDSPRFPMAGSIAPQPSELRFSADTRTGTRLIKIEVTEAPHVKIIAVYDT